MVAEKALEPLLPTVLRYHLPLPLFPPFYAMAQSHLRTLVVTAFPGDPVVEYLPANAGDMGSILGQRRFQILQGS